MNDLFEKEQRALNRANEFLENLEEHSISSFRKEFTHLTGEYAQMLHQLRWVTRISDLTTWGLNTDKITLLNKVNVDALTEIYNRRFLMTNMEPYLAELELSGGWITIMMLDVDFFKHYNDTYGHSVGDVCLRKIASALHNSLSGADDFVVRYGGEEFIAVLPGVGKEMGTYTAQKMLNAIEDLKIPHESSSIADHITISVGVVSALASSNHRMQQYIDQADAALYESKHNGRNRVTYKDFVEDKAE